jgi:tripartite ATP-independent transporter DctM subunit
MTKMFDPTIAIALLIGIFAILIILKVPMVFALAASTTVTMIYTGIPLMAMVQQMAKSINSFSLMAVPFFILAGEIMSAGGLSMRLTRFANVLVGRFRGGLAQVNVVGSMFYGGISGSAVADVSSLGVIEIDMMTKAGYERDFTTAVTVTSACQGVVIPPSHNLIIYAMAAGGLSVGRLLIAGYIPGILLGVSLMAICFIFAIKRNFPRGEKVSLREGLKITWNALLALFTAVIIVGGTVSGIFTATESSAFACIYAFIIAVFVYRDLKIKQLPKLLFKTIKTLALVFSLIAAAGGFGWMMAYLQIPKLITEALLALTSSKIVILLIINVMLLALGCIMDMAPLIIICTPILLPVVMQYGIDPIHFGIIMVLNLAIGLTTPPIGSALFVGCAIGKISIEKAAKAIWPMWISMVAVLMLVTFVPELTMWLPNLLMK